MNGKSHPLFEAYPLSGERQISVGPVPVPYHTYDGHGLLVGGTAGLDNIRELLQAEQVYPLETEAGRALMGIWLVDFTAASLGPHQELQFSILVSHRPTAAIAPHPFAQLQALFVRPEVRMFCFRLWNDSPTAVAYNRELLGLPAAPAGGAIQRSAGSVSFRFVDGADQLLLEGQVQAARQTPLRAGWALLRQLGLRHALRAFSQPYLEAKVVNPISETFPTNADARSLLAADTPVVRFFDPAGDRLTFGAAYAGVFDFRPAFVEHFSPFRFVYLQPEQKKE